MAYKTHTVPASILRTGKPTILLATHIDFCDDSQLSFAPDHFVNFHKL